MDPADHQPTNMPDRPTARVPGAHRTVLRDRRPTVPRRRPLDPPTQRGHIRRSRERREPLACPGRVGTRPGPPPRPTYQEDSCEDPCVSRRLLVVEDDDAIVEFLSVGLAAEGFEVIVARTGHAALAALDEKGPFELVVLDLLLPGVHGLEVLSVIRRRGDLPVVILSAQSEVGDRVTGLQAGADDYLPKPFRFEELLARIQAVLRRRDPTVDQMLRVGNLVVDHATRVVTRSGQPVDVTTKEFDLLELLATNIDRVLTREVIVDRLWGLDELGDSNVLEVHVSNLRRKLETHGPRLVHTVRSVGYVLRPPR